VRARRRAASARLLIVNHALLARAGESDGLLPEYDLLVVDEAHRLEGVLLAQLERSVSRHRFEEALRLLGSRRGPRAGGLLARARGLALPLFAEGDRADLSERLDQLTRRIGEAREVLEGFFAAVEPRGARHALYGARERYRSGAELMGRDLGPLEALLNVCASFASGLTRVGEAVGAIAPRGSDAGSLEEELRSELEQAAGLWSGLGADLEHVAEAADRDWVYWRTAGGRGVELHAAPVAVGDHARQRLFGRATAVVLTSATLAADGDFEFTAERLGLGERHRMPYQAISYPSPFPARRPDAGVDRGLGRRRSGRHRRHGSRPCGVRAQRAGAVHRARAPAPRAGALARTPGTRLCPARAGMGRHRLAGQRAVPRAARGRLARRSKLVGRCRLSR
jgi:Rad3-related DNA helicase